MVSIQQAKKHKQKKGVPNVTPKPAAPVKARATTAATGDVEMTAAAGAQSSQPDLQFGKIELAPKDTKPSYATLKKKKVYVDQARIGWWDAYVVSAVIRVSDCVSLYPHAVCRSTLGPAFL